MNQENNADVEGGGSDDDLRDHIPKELIELPPGTPEMIKTHVGGWRKEDDTQDPIQTLADLKFSRHLLRRDLMQSRRHALAKTCRTLWRRKTRRHWVKRNCTKLAFVWMARQC